MLMIRLEESDCFASWVLGDKTGLPNADADIKGDYTPSFKAFSPHGGSYCTLLCSKGLEYQLYCY